MGRYKSDCTLVWGARMMEHPVSASSLAHALFASLQVISDKKAHSFPVKSNLRMLKKLNVSFPNSSYIYLL